MFSSRGPRRDTKGSFLDRKVQHPLALRSFVITNNSQSPSKHKTRRVQKSKSTRIRILQSPKLKFLKEQKPTFMASKAQNDGLLEEETSWGLGFRKISIENHLEIVEKSDNNKNPTFVRENTLPKAMPLAFDKNSLSNIQLRRKQQINSQQKFKSIDLTGGGSNRLNLPESKFIITERSLQGEDIDIKKNSRQRKKNVIFMSNLDIQNSLVKLTNGHIRQDQTKAEQIKHEFQSIANLEAKYLRKSELRKQAATFITNNIKHLHQSALPQRLILNMYMKSRNDKNTQKADFYRLQKVPGKNKNIRNYQFFADKAYRNDDLVSDYIFEVQPNFIESKGVSLISFFMRVGKGIPSTLKVVRDETLKAVSTFLALTMIINNQNIPKSLKNALLYA